MKLHGLMEDLFPMRRSLTGDGVRETLRRIQREIPIEIHEVPSGTKCFDWTIPDEWRFGSARLFDEAGALLIDADNNFLHVLGYSAPFTGWVSLDELREHLVVGPEEYPDAIEYTTSYFERRWGLSISWNQAKALKPGKYFVKVESELVRGSLTYADLVVPWEGTNEIFLGVYCCHPNLAINELSGPVVMVGLVEWWMSEPRRHTLRVLIAPETIGPLVYMSHGGMLQFLKDRMCAGFVLSCLAGRGHFSVQEGRLPNYASAIAKYVLCPPSVTDSLFGVSPWMCRGSDERQWCAPGVDLPVCSIRKSVPGSDEYPEYHLSTDNLEACTEEQLQDSLEVMKQILTAIERDKSYRSVTIGEPQLGRRGLYAMLSKRGSSASGKALLDVWSYCDGRSSLEIAKALEKPIDEVQVVLDILEDEGIVEVMK